MGADVHHPKHNCSSTKRVWSLKFNVQGERCLEHPVTDSALNVISRLDGADTTHRFSPDTFPVNYTLIILGGQEKSWTDSAPAESPTQLYSVHFIQRQYEALGITKFSIHLNPRLSFTSFYLTSETDSVAIPRVLPPHETAVPCFFGISLSFSIITGKFYPWPCSAMKEAGEQERLLLVKRISHPSFALLIDHLCCWRCWVMRVVYFISRYIGNSYIPLINVYLFSWLACTPELLGLRSSAASGVAVGSVTVTVTNTVLNLLSEDSVTVLVIVVGSWELSVS